MIPHRCRCGESRTGPKCQAPRGFDDEIGAAGSEPRLDLAGFVVPPQLAVALACVVLLLLALALPPPSALGLATSLAAAGLIGASFSLFSLSYSLWNEAFWAMVALVAAAIIIVDRLRTTP